MIAEASLGPYAWESFSSKTEQSSKTAKPISIHVARGRTRSPVTRSGPKESTQPIYLQNEELRKLDRTTETFAKIEQEAHMSYSLPKPGATAGRVLAHASVAFERLHAKRSPMSFKFGISHDPVFRWYHRPYGYKYGCERFDRMLIIFASPSPVAVAFLEASLIDKFGSFSALHC